MRVVRILLIALLVGIVTVMVYAGWKKGGPNQLEIAFNPGGKVSLDLSAGGYEITGTTENKIRVRLDPGDTREVTCHIRVNGSNANVEIDGPSNKFRATIFVPQRSDLTVDQTIGDLVVTNVEGNKKLGLNIGQIQLEEDRGASLPSFAGSVIIGDLRAEPWNVEKGGFFRGFNTHSSGSPYSINAHVDIGDLKVIDRHGNIGESHAEKSGDTDNDVSDKDSEDESQ
jgi:hypothetical protein